MHVSPFSNVDKPAWLGFCCHNLFMWKIQGSALLSCDQSKSWVFSSNSHDCKVWLLLSLNWEDLKVVKRTISYSNVKPILRTLSLLPNVGSEIYYCFSIRILSSFSKKCEILECYCYEMLSQLDIEISMKIEETRIWSIQSDFHLWRMTITTLTLQSLKYNEMFS